MSKVIINDDSNKVRVHSIFDVQRLYPIFDVQHRSKIINNNAYVVNTVLRAVAREEYSIDLDESKIKQKVNTGTLVRLYDRQGNDLSLKYTFDGITTNKAVIGSSRPQHGDKFSKVEGRKYALANAISSMKLQSNDPNFIELLRLKQFLSTYELVNGVTPVSYQFMDFWLAFIDYTNLSFDPTDSKYEDQYSVITNNWQVAINNLFGTDEDSEEFVDSILGLNEMGVSLIELYPIVKSMITSIGLY